VTHEDIRRLIGGYATGTLTEAEQRLLFDAALNDQELFDELSREQALKEMLDEPGTRQRLIAALGQPKPKQFVWWPWAAAGTAIAGAMVAIVFMWTPAKQEIAMVTPAPAPVVKDEPAQPMPPPKPASVKQKVAGPAPAPRAPANERDERREANAITADNTGAVAAERAQSAPAAAPPPPRAARAVGALSGFREVPAAKPVRFAFDYTIEPNGTLTITPSADGYLGVIAMNGDTAGPVLGIEGAGPDGRVQAGSQVSVNVRDRDAVQIVFSASPSPAPAQTPVRRDEHSGTVADPAPSPASSLTVVISVR